MIKYLLVLTLPLGKASPASKPTSQPFHCMKRIRLPIPILLALLFLAAAPQARAAGTLPFSQPAEQVYNEAQTVYLGNLARRANGLPPLRWNRDLSDAARWFSWDSVENRSSPYCGHQDTQGNWPSDRALTWGYLGFAGAENAFCGYVTPQQAIDGWMSSDGHRTNLLSPNHREVGLGYYRRASDGRGYVTQDFGSDEVYAPVIIENEAIQTASGQVGLYVYRKPSSGFASMGPATEMRIGNDACFSGSTWQPYAAETSWSLDPGSGWRTVYVQTRDAAGRTATVNDTIYLGSAAPADQIGYDQAAARQPQVQLNNLDSGGLPLMQFSLNWRVDDSYDNFDWLWGNGGTASDGEAWGGTAFRMTPGNGESSAWVWTSEFIRDTPFVGYVRLKVSSNASTSEVARVSVAGSQISLRGTDFAQANRYQEFPIPFTFASGTDFLIFQFWRSGSADVSVDGVTIYTAPQPAVSTYTWNVPGGNYRGQGIWVRYTDGAGTFRDGAAPDTAAEELDPNPSALSFLASPASPAPAQLLAVTSGGCGSPDWTASENIPWLQLQRDGDRLTATASAAGLGSGTYSGTIRITPDDPTLDALDVPVTLHVVSQVHKVHLPAIQRP